MPTELFDRPPRKDVYPSTEELRRAPQSIVPSLEELDAPDDLVLDETAVTRARMPAVSWPDADKDAPDYAHLEPMGREPRVGDKQFTFTADDMDRLLEFNAFDPKGPDDRVVIAIRGANLVDKDDGENDGAVAAVDRLVLEETRPDHKNFRCVIGYYSRKTRLFSAYRASTVPNAKYVTNYYMHANGLGGTPVGNMLPTGCYVFRVGSHHNGDLYPALRLTDPERLTEDGAAVVLRTKNDTSYKLDDIYDPCVSQDHVHCAYEVPFSSAGCLTVQGPPGEGPWGRFQSILKTMKANTRIDVVLLTGRDASIANYLRVTDKVKDADYARRLLQRLRPGSTGEAVSRLQEKLGIKPSGYFGPNTKVALVDLQRQKKLPSDGIWRPALDDELGWAVLKPAAAAPAAAPPATVATAPAAAAQTAPSGPSAPAVAAAGPAVQPPPAPQPAPTVQPPPIAQPAAQPIPAAAAVAAVAPAAVAAAATAAQSATPSASPELTRAAAANFAKEGDGAGWGDDFEQEAPAGTLTRGSEGWTKVHWVKDDKDSTEYRHLADSPAKGAAFELGADALELLIKANGFEPLRDSGKIVFGLRGAVLAASPGSPDDKFRQIDRQVLRLEETRPDHQHFRCTIGVYDIAKRTLTGFIASTVPCRQAVYGFINGGEGSNLLPTGCYHLVCGPHKGRNGCLREDEDFTVLRTKKDYAFDTKDEWDHNFPADNLHPAFANSSAEFSSWGCQTIRGNYDRSDGTFSGEYKLFRQALGLKPGTGSHGAKFDYVLLTGLEAATAAGIPSRDPSGPVSGDVAARLARLRHGSRGDAVRRLQLKLGLEPTGVFDAAVKKSLADAQFAKLGWADGIYGAEMDKLLGFDVMAPPPAPVAPPVAPSAAAPLQPPVAQAPAPAPQPVPAAQPAPVQQPAPVAQPVPVAQAPKPAAPQTAPAPVAAAAATAAGAASPAIAAALNQMAQGGQQTAPAQVASATPAVDLNRLNSVRTTVPPSAGAALPPRDARPSLTPASQLATPAAASRSATPIADEPTGPAVSAPRLVFTPETIKAFAPHALPLYREALLAGNDVLTRYGVNQTPLRFCHFLGQIGDESGRLTVLEENMNYRTAARIRAVWPSRFPTLASAEPYVNQPQKLAEKVYGDRFDNRPGDGYRFRGRGLVQITGRSSYREMGRKLGIPLEDKPELALDPQYVLAIACETWLAKQMSGERDMNKLADDNKLEAVTYRINGGYTNIDDRRSSFCEAWDIWSSGDAPLRQLEPDVLDRGDRGSRVEELNARLKGLDLFQGAAAEAPSHVFNATTYRAVRALQAHAGLPETGVVTADTWAALDKAVERRLPTRGAPVSRSAPPRRDPVARRLAELRAWSIAMAILAIAFICTHLFALNQPGSNTVAWLPLLFGGAVFVAGLALWLASRPQPHWHGAGGTPLARSASKPATAAGVEEPVRQGINLD